MSRYTIADIFDQRRKLVLTGNEYIELEDITSGTVGAQTKDIAKLAADMYVDTVSTSGTGTSVIYSDNIEGGVYRVRLRDIEGTNGNEVTLSDDGRTLQIAQGVDSVILTNETSAFVVPSTSAYHNRKLTMVNMSDVTGAIDFTGSRFMGTSGAIVESIVKYDSIEIMGIYDSVDATMDWVSMNVGSWTISI
jgi:hypothetical protein